MSKVVDLNDRPQVDKDLENKKDEEINLLEYIYDNDTLVKIPGKMLEGLIQILRQVEQSETTYGLTASYPTKAGKLVKNEDGHVTEVKTEYEQYPSAESYFSQQPVETRSMLGAMALDLLMLLQQEHLANIRSGVAKKLGTVNKPTDEIKLDD